MNPSNKPYRHAQRGVTLVELLVAVVIGLVVVLAATSVVVMGESYKRSTTSSNDINQSGSYSAYVLDRALRSAGSGLVQSWDQGVFGCKLNVARSINGTVITLLPRTTAFPAPFQAFLGGAGANKAGDLRMAPVLIGKGQSAGGSDVLMVMGGNGSAGDSARPIRSAVGSDGLRLDNTISLAGGDLALVAQPGSTDCLIEQIGATDTAFTAIGNEVVPLGGEYFNGASALATMAASGLASFSVLGNVAANNVQLQLIGVDADRTLVAYDLLRAAADSTNADPLLPLADGVAELHAIYGVDNGPANDGIVDNWVAPTGDWAIESVMTNPALMRQIVAVRVAIVMRASNYEKEVVTRARPALFSDTSAAVSAVPYAAGDNQHFRLRVIDTTIPLRNMLLLPAP